MATPSSAPEETVSKPPPPPPAHLPSYLPLALATPVGQQTMRAAGARRGGGTEMTQNHTRPHLLNPAGLRHGPPATPGWRFRLDIEMEVGEQLAARLPQTEGWEAAPGMSFLARPRTQGKRGPPGRPSCQGRGSAVAREGAEAGGGRPQPPAPPRPPAPHGAPARPRRPPGGGLGTRSRPRPGPAYPGRCSPHTPPLAAPSGTSSAATRPQPSGPAWGARAAGPGGGGPCCPARLQQGPG